MSSKEIKLGLKDIVFVYVSISCPSLLFLTNVLALWAKPELEKAR